MNVADSHEPHVHGGPLGREKRNNFDACDSTSDVEPNTQRIKRLIYDDKFARFTKTKKKIWCNHYRTSSIATRITQMLTIFITCFKVVSAVSHDVKSNIIIQCKACGKKIHKDHFLIDQIGFRESAEKNEYYLSEFRKIKGLTCDWCRRKSPTQTLLNRLREIHIRERKVGSYFTFCRPDNEEKHAKILSISPDGNFFNIRLHTGDVEEFYRWDCIRTIVSSQDLASYQKYFNEGEYDVGAEAKTQEEATEIRDQQLIGWNVEELKHSMRRDQPQDGHGQPVRAPSRSHSSEHSGTRSALPQPIPRRTNVEADGAIHRAVPDPLSPQPGSMSNTVVYENGDTRVIQHKTCPVERDVIDRIFYEEKKDHVVAKNVKGRQDKDRVYKESDEYLDLTKDIDSTGSTVWKEPDVPDDAKISPPINKQKIEEPEESVESRLLQYETFSKIYNRFGKTSRSHARTQKKLCILFEFAEKGNEENKLAGLIKNLRKMFTTEKKTKRAVDRLYRRFKESRNFDEKDKPTTLEELVEKCFSKERHWETIVPEEPVDPSII